MPSGTNPRKGEDYITKTGWHLSSQQGCVFLVTSINFCFLFPGMCIHLSFLNLCNCINDTVPQFVKDMLRWLRQMWPTIIFITFFITETKNGFQKIQLGCLKMSSILLQPPSFLGWYGLDEGEPTWTTTKTFDGGRGSPPCSCPLFALIRQHLCQLHVHYAPVYNDPSEYTRKETKKQTKKHRKKQKTTPTSHQKRGMTGKTKVKMMNVEEFWRMLQDTWRDRPMAVFWLIP